MGNSLMNATSNATALCANAARSAFSKLSGDNIVALIGIVFACGTVCYVCHEGGVFKVKWKGVEVEAQGQHS